MPVLSIVILKFLCRARNYSGLPLLKVDMFVLYVSDVACEGFSRILTLVMCVACSPSNFILIKGYQRRIYVGLQISSDPCSMFHG